MKRDAQTSILQACARFLRRQLDPVLKRLGGIEERALTLEKLQDSVLVREIFAGIALEQVRKLELPAGRKGDDGKDAEPVLVADVVAELVRCADLKPVLDLLCTEAVAKHFEANPVRDGASATPEMVAKAVAEHLQANPIPEPKPGRDGLDVKDLFRADGGRLMAVLSDGTTRDLGVFVGKDGEDGKDGADFSDVEFDYDGERGLIIRGRGGDIVKRLPIPIDKGYHRDGMACEKGDIVTTEGSAWIALCDTKAKPSTDSADWRLFARKGRDAGPVRMAEPAPSGPVKLG